MNVQTYIQMKKIIFIASIFLMVAFGFESCQEEERWYTDQSAPAPGQVTVKSITPKRGGAVIRYEIPNDKNLSAVKARYVRNGEVCETIASLYIDSLVISGYGDTQTQNVDLYSIGRNEKTSAPLAVQITPLKPQFLSVNVTLETTFGGVSVVFSGNDTNDNLAFVLMADTTGKGVWTPLQTFYVAADKGRFSRRNLASKEQKFALYVRDRWNNKSDTLIQLLTPLEEIKLPKDTWTNAKLPTDSWQPADNNARDWALENLWMGPEAPGGVRYAWASPSTTPFPQHFTIDLGYTTSISRMVMWTHNSYMYSSIQVRTFELWGSDNPPTDGSWDNWFLLGKYEMFKPSGYGADGSVGTITAEDREYYLSAQDYEIMPSDEIPNPYRQVRYIRFKTLSTFASFETNSPTGYASFAEMALYGTPIDN
jgi:hypothetical protein